MKTYDKKKVKEGDKVFVISSTGKVESAMVLEPVTSYELFGPVPVSSSFSSIEAAEEYLKTRFTKHDY